MPYNGVYKDKGVNMKNSRLEMKVRQATLRAEIMPSWTSKEWNEYNVRRATLIASLPFEYDPKDTTLRGNATPNHTVGMARAKRLALKGLEAVA
jgi:hypothetical protein